MVGPSIQEEKTSYLRRMVLDPAACRGATPPSNSIPEKHEPEMRQVDWVDTWNPWLARLDLGAAGAAPLPPILCRHERPKVASGGCRRRVAARQGLGPPLAVSC